MKTYTAIGLMSGTSLDGLDICHCSFTQKQEGWAFEILHAETIPYNEISEARLRNSMKISAEELMHLNAEYGIFIGETVKNFIAENNIKNLDVISSHGHTVFHQPKRKFTTQIGDGRAIKAITGVPVVYDFRQQDVFLGGNGAPLVPIGDELLFGAYDACLNLGGFSNISYKKDHRRIAFDISPVNFVLNHYAEKLGKKYDENGGFARSGTIDEAILSELNHLEFYQQNPPKSLGAEWVKEFILPKLEILKPADALATFTEHAGFQIRKIFESENLKNVLITGGGAYNSYLIEKISNTETKIIIPNPEILEYKEALVFAFMGLLKILGENNVLSSATGSYTDHSTGIIA